MLKKHLLFAFLSLAQIGLNAQVQLVKDIYSGGSHGMSSSASSPVVLNNKLIFSATNATNGTELWISDGTSNGTTLLKDIYPGSESSYAGNLTLAGNYVFFTAKNAVNGIEVWRTDGTSAGTIMVDDLNPNGDGVPSFVFGNKFLVSSDKFYYIGTDGDEKGIWVTDGTPGNTVKVRKSSDIKDLVAIWDNRLVFTEYYYNGNYTANVWISEGTQASTQKISTFQVTFSGITNQFAPIDSLLYFLMSTPDQGYELWAMDGSPNSGHVVKEIEAGSTDGINPNFGKITVHDGQLYFIATTADNLQQLWKSDGSLQGTTKVKDLTVLNPSTPAGLGREEMVSTGTHLFFSVYSGDNAERALWVSDGTEIGTYSLGTNPDGSYFNPINLFASDSKVFFSGNNTKGRELWRSDGTISGTGIFTDIYTGSGSSNPSSFVKVQDTLYFAATTSQHGNELRRLNLQSVGSVEPLSEIAAFTMAPNPGTDFVVLSMKPMAQGLSDVNIFNYNGQLVWQAKANGSEIQIPVSSFSPGTYYVQYGNDCQKLIVEH